MSARPACVAGHARSGGTRRRDTCVGGGARAACARRAQRASPGRGCAAQRSCEWAGRPRSGQRVSGARGARRSGAERAGGAERSGRRSPTSLSGRRAYYGWTLPFWVNFHHRRLDAAKHTSAAHVLRTRTVAATAAARAQPVTASSGMMRGRSATEPQTTHEVDVDNDTLLHLHAVDRTLRLGDKVTFTLLVTRTGVVQSVTVNRVRDGEDSSNEGDVAAALDALHGLRCIARLGSRSARSRSRSTSRRCGRGIDARSAPSSAAASTIRRSTT